MSFPQEFLDELRARVAVSELVRKKVVLKRAGREWVGLSPFQKERTPSFYVNDEKGFYHDFSSGRHGDIFQWLIDAEGLEFPEAVKTCADIAGLPLPQDTRGGPKVDTSALTAVLGVALRFFQEQLALSTEVKDALALRGVEQDTITRFGIGYAPPGSGRLLDQLRAGDAIPAGISAGLLYEGSGGVSDRFRDRIMIPIYDARERIVGFGGRAMGDAKPKYLNSPETPVFHKGSLLFNYANARRAAARVGANRGITVVEGYFDVIAMVLAGYESTVATMGTAVTPEQLSLLWKASDEPVLCFDGDAAGRRAAWRTLDTALPLLQSGKSLSFAMLPDGKDPDEIVRGEDEGAMDRALRKAAPFVDVLWARESDGDWDTPEKRAGLEKRITDLTDLIKDEALRAQYRRDLRARFDVLVAAAVAAERPEVDISFQGVDQFEASFMEAVACDRVVFICANDEAVEAMTAIGVPAAAAPGGIPGWGPQHSLALKGADVIVLLGANGYDASECCASIAVHATRVRTLRLPVNPADWVAAGGTAEKLFDGIAQLGQDWRHEPFKSKFGFLPIEDLYKPGPERADIIDGLFTEGDRSVIGGPSGSGKSYFIIHAAMCIALAQDFFGYKVVAPGLVLYQAGEGTLGVKDRFKAWLKAKRYAPGTKMPIGMLLSPIDIFKPDGDTQKLIEEIGEIKKLYPNVPLRMLIIDTLATATGGADENSGRDMGTVMTNVAKISKAVGCHVCLVHHLNASGSKLRGHTSIYANMDQVFLVTEDETTGIRTAVLDKQKDGERGVKIEFRLKSVEVRIREVDQKQITNCLAIPAETSKTTAVGSESKPRLQSLRFNAEKTVILRMLSKALTEHGQPKPAVLADLPRDIRVVTTMKHWHDAYREVASEASESAMQRRIRNAELEFLKLGVIGKKAPFVWLTGTAVVGVVSMKPQSADNGLTRPAEEPGLPMIPENSTLEDELGRS